MIVSMPCMSLIRCGDGSSNGLTVPLPPKKKPVISCRRSPPATVNNGGAHPTDSLVPPPGGKKNHRRPPPHHPPPPRRYCQEAIVRFDRFEEAMREVQEGLECVDLEDGHLRQAGEVEAMIEHAADSLQVLDPACHKVARYLRNRAAGLSLAPGELNTRLHELATTYSLGAVAVACMLGRLVFELQNDRRPWQRTRQHRHLLGAFAYLKYLLGPQLDALLNAVKALLEQRHRVSRAIEGFNAALRPFLYVHKGVTQGFLELFRAYPNLKTRRWGPHQGTSAHHCLTGQAVGDWLTLLGFPPSSTLH